MNVFALGSWLLGAHVLAGIVVCYRRGRQYGRFPIETAAGCMASVLVPMINLALLFTVIFVWHASPVVQGNVGDDRAMRGWVFLSRHIGWFLFPALICLLVHFIVIIGRIVTYARDWSETFNAFWQRMKDELDPESHGKPSRAEPPQVLRSGTTIFCLIGLADAFMACYIAGSLVPSA